MNKEEKQLLLKDLCARLPYGVICYGVTKDMDEDGNYIDKVVTGTLYELHSYKCCYGLVGLMNQCNIESIKPYLRPISNMTQEEIYDYNKMCNKSLDVLDIFDWLNAHHFDYRGLIEKGLALEAKEDMYKEK